MSFLAPIAGLAAFAVGASVVILVYMLRLRRRPTRVSSTLLWRSAADEMEGNIPWRAAKPGLLMLLQLFGVLLLAAALARPVIGGAAGSIGSVTVVIDTGASMGSIVDTDGSTRLDRAKAEARRLVRSAGGDGASIRVVRGGVDASVVSRGASWREASRLIDGLQVDDTASDLEEAVMLAREGSGDDDPTLIVLSDRVGALFAVVGVDPGEADDDAVELRNIGVAALGAQRDGVDPELVRFFVRLAGRSESPVSGVVRLFVGGTELASRAVSVEPDEDGVLSHDLSVEARVTDPALVRVGIEVDDALETDNNAWVELPAPDPVRTLVVAPDSGPDVLLIDALRAVTRGPVEEVGEGDASLAASFDWVVFDRVVPVVLPEVPSVVFAGAQGQEVLTRRLVTWDRSDQLMRDLELSRLVFIGGAAAPDGARVVARTREDAVIWSVTSGGVRHVRVTFALEDSNFGVLVSFPMFLANTLETLVPGVRGSGVVRRVGERVLIAAGADETLARAPITTARLGAMIGNERELIGAARAGVYETSAGARVAISVLDEEVSRRAGTRSDSQTTPSLSGTGSFDQGRRELWRVLALAALVVLSVEWVLDVMRRRV